MKVWSLFLLTLIAISSHAQTLLKIDNAGISLDGYFYTASRTDDRKAPAIVALHGCAGMLNSQGKPNLRTAAYAKLLNEQGWHVVFLDSFTARGVKSVCGTGRIPPSQRVGDVQALMALLAARTDVDTSRLAILGWSHGGSTTLLANDQSVSYSNTPRAAVAFYPGCGDGRTRGGAMAWQPARPVLMQLGADDDWTSPLPCQNLAARWPDLVRQTTYANASHGFDSDAPVRPIHLSTPRGAKTVHAGGDPAAKAASQAAVITFLKEQLK